MATVWRQRKGELIHEYGGPAKAYRTAELFGAKVEACSFCGERTAAGWWRASEGLVTCCRGCATDALPKLMADALVGESGELPRVCDGMAAAFVAAWTAARLALRRVTEVAARREGPKRRGWPPRVSKN